jgi:Putative transposase
MNNDFTKAVKPGAVSVRAEDCLSGGGDMGALMRSIDWSTRVFGPVAEWPQSLMTLSAEEFIRRFWIHVLPDRFQRIRYYGFLSNRHREENTRTVPSSAGHAACESGKDLLRAIRLRL